MLLCGLALALSSCEDWLDVDSPSSRPAKDFYQTPVQAEQALHPEALSIFPGMTRMGKQKHKEMHFQCILDI